MAKTINKSTIIEAIEQQRECIENKLKEIKSGIDDFDTKKRGAELELSRLKKIRLWGRLFKSCQDKNG